MKAQRLAALAQAREQAPLLANAVGNRVTYGEGHPLAENALGTEASIKAVDAAALRSFWKAHYRPERAALVVAGDLSEAELRALVEPLFGAWKGEGAAPAATPAAGAQADHRAHRRRRQARRAADGAGRRGARPFRVNA